MTKKRKKKDKDFESLVTLDIGIKGQIDPKYYIEGEIQSLKIFNFDRVMSVLNSSLLKMYFNKERNGYSDSFFRWSKAQPDEIDWDVLLLVLISKLEFSNSNSLDFYSEEQKKRLDKRGNDFLKSIKVNKGSGSSLVFPENETNFENADAKMSILINQIISSTYKEGRILLAQLQPTLWD